MDSSAVKCGYDDRMFISDIPDYLYCVVCTLILRDPVMIPQCGHKFCRSCFKQMEVHSLTTSELRCPIDRAEIDTKSVQDDIAMKRGVGNLLVKCNVQEHGCGWTGELTELDFHIDKCPCHCSQENGEKDIVNKLSTRLYQCEKSLLAKDREIVSLKLLIQEQRQQQQLQLQRQQEEGQKQFQKLLEQLYQQEQQQQRQLEASKSVLSENMKVLEYKLKKSRMDFSEKLGALHNKLHAVQSRPSATRLPLAHPDTESAKDQDLCLDYQKLTKWKLLDTPARKKKGFHHHSGDPSKVTICNVQKTVKFEQFATVSCPSAIVSEGMKAWYEIGYTDRCSGVTWQHVGWATSSLPISQEYTVTGVGYGPESYGFKPFNEYKIHNAPESILDYKTWEHWGDRIEGFVGTVGVALDMVKGEILYAVEGKWTDELSCHPRVAFKDVDTTKQYFPAISGANDSFRYNFGERKFCYGPPDPSFVKLIDAV